MDTSNASNGLDFRNILETPLRQFVPWLAAVLLVTFAGYPGVVCVTPLAWLIALQVGNVAVRRSRSASSASRKLEAALAGAFLGLLQGILFAVIITQLEPINADEQARTISLTIGMIVVGIVFGAILAFITAYFSEQRRQPR